MSIWSRNLRIIIVSFAFAILNLGVLAIPAHATSYSVTTSAFTHGKVSAVVKTTASGTLLRTDAASTSLSESITNLQTITITFLPDTGYQLTSFTDNTVSKTTSTYVISNPSVNHSLSSITFAQQTFQVTPSASTGGTISPAAAQTITYGGSSTFTMTPNAGYQISSILVNGSAVSGTASGSSTIYIVQNVTSSSTVAVNFSINTYTVTTVAGLHGSITGSGSSNTMNYGESQTYTVTPAANYHILTLTLDGQATTSPISISNITANHTINATFAIDLYSTTVTQPLNGSITPSGTVTSESQSDQVLTVTSDYGYHIASVTSDGVVSNISNSATTYTKHYNPISSSHTFTATMAINAYTISITVGANGSSSVPTHQATHGSTETITFTPDNHYRISNVTLDGSAWTSPYVLSNITAPHSISVNFEQSPELALFSFTPAIFGAGDLVTISGSSLELASDVKLNGVSLSSFTLVDGGAITFNAPSSATNGLISLVGPNGTVNSTQSFTFIKQTVTTSGACPTSTGNNAIAISGGACVKPGASTVIPAPVISSLSASTIAAGGSLVIRGSNFSGIRSIWVGTTQVTVFTLNSPGQITIKIPASTPKNQYLRVTINGSPATPSGLPQSATSVAYVRVIA